MGTLSPKKFLRLILGIPTEENALTTSAGAADADKIPALNAAGVLDSTIVNSTTTSLGAGSAGKVAALDAAGILGDTLVNSTNVSVGAGSAGKRVELNAAGKIDDSMLSFGPELSTATASEALSAGNLVNVYNNAGVWTMRKADAASNRPANGYVLAAVASAAVGTYYSDGRITGLSGLTPGLYFLGAAGAITQTPPTASGSCSQQVGNSASATELMFNPKIAIVLA